MMALPARRTGSRLAERRIPGWAGDPLAEFDDLFSRIGNLLETTVGGGLAATAGALAPTADVSETDDAYLIEVDLPGVKRDDIDIETSERELVISGEFKERERAGVLRRGTRRTGRFEYRAVLPGEVNAKGVSANLADGVLSGRPKRPSPATSRSPAGSDHPPLPAPLQSSAGISRPGTGAAHKPRSLRRARPRVVAAQAKQLPARAFSCSARRPPARQCNCHSESSGRTPTTVDGVPSHTPPPARHSPRRAKTQPARQRCGHAPVTGRNRPAARARRRWSPGNLHPCPTC
jgi:HSP20 family protein